MERDLRARSCCGHDRRRPPFRQAQGPEPAEGEVAVHLSVFATANGKCLQLHESGYANARADVSSESRREKRNVIRYTTQGAGRSFRGSSAPAGPDGAAMSYGLAAAGALFSA